MAFPTVEATNFTNGTTASISKTCNLPSGIVADSLLILVLRSAGADVHGTPSGWTALVLNNTSDASNDSTSIYYKVANGSEGGTVIVSATASLKFASVSWRVHNHIKTTAPEITAVATGTSTAPDSTSLTPAGGPKDFLWASVSAYEGEQTDPPTYPTNYSVGQRSANSDTAGAVATNCRANIAGRQLNGSSEDPGAWSISVSDDWSAWTLAVHPGSDPVPPSGPPLQILIN